MDKDLKIILMEILKSKGISVPRFANAIGIPKDRIYKWYQQGSSPKPEDALKIEDWIKKSNITQGSLKLNTTIKPLPAERSTREAALEYENMQLRLEKLETNLSEVLSNQRVLMTMLSVAMNTAAEFYSGGNKSKADALKNKMRTEIAAGTK